MPTYDYKCSSDHVTEVRGVKYVDRDEKQECETCGNEAARIPSAPYERKMRLNNHPKNKNQNLSEY